MLNRVIIDFTAQHKKHRLTNNYSVRLLCCKGFMQKTDTEKGDAIATKKSIIHNPLCQHFFSYHWHNFIFSYQLKVKSSRNTYTIDGKQFFNQF